MAALRVQVVSGTDAAEMVSRLREHDQAELLAVVVADRPGLAAVALRPALR